MTSKQLKEVLGRKDPRQYLTDEWSASTEPGFPEIARDMLTSVSKQQGELFGGEMRPSFWWRGKHDDWNCELIQHAHPSLGELCHQIAWRDQTVAIFFSPRGHRVVGRSSLKSILSQTKQIEAELKCPVRLENHSLYLGRGNRFDSGFAINLFGSELSIPIIPFGLCRAELATTDPALGPAVRRFANLARSSVPPDGMQPYFNEYANWAYQLEAYLQADQQGEGKGWKVNRHDVTTPRFHHEFLPLDTGVVQVEGVGILNGKNIALVRRGSTPKTNPELPWSNATFREFHHYLHEQILGKPVRGHTREKSPSRPVGPDMTVEIDLG